MRRWGSLSIFNGLFVALKLCHLLFQSFYPPLVSFNNQLELSHVIQNGFWIKPLKLKMVTEQAVLTNMMFKCAPSFDFTK